MHAIRANPVCPDELIEGYPATGILANDDFQDDTLTGAETSHRTNVMFVQPDNLISTDENQAD